VRSACAALKPCLKLPQALIQFLLDYPVGAARLRRHLAFLLSNLAYEHEVWHGFPVRRLAWALHHHDPFFGEISSGLHWPPDHTRHITPPAVDGQQAAAHLTFLPCESCHTFQ
jgi:hypothetical protein